MKVLVRDDFGLLHVADVPFTPHPDRRTVRVQVWLACLHPLGTGVEHRIAQNGQGLFDWDQTALGDEGDVPTCLLCIARETKLKPPT